MLHSEAIRQDTVSYRRGVVLGMTMAEVFLLLLFCLLIAAAVLFQRAAQSGDELAEKSAQQQQEIAALRETLDQVVERNLPDTTESGAAKPEDNWRKLVDDQLVLNRAREAGLDIESLTASAEQIRAVQPLIEQGVSGEQLARHHGFAERLLSALAGSDIASESPEQLADMARRGSNLNLASAGEHNWPPIVSLSEAGGYSFETGRAELDSAFLGALKGPIIDQVADIVSRYDANIVEVVGHTDERNLPQRVSNLDQSLFAALRDDLPIGSLSPSDNTGLGMARAVSVARVLRQDSRLQGVTVLPLSGGQLIEPGDGLSEGTTASDEANRRRIEIRVRRPG